MMFEGSRPPISEISYRSVHDALAANESATPYVLPESTRAELVVDLGASSKKLGIVSFVEPVEVVYDQRTSLQIGTVDEPVAVFKPDSEERRNTQKQQRNAIPRVAELEVNLDDMDSLLYIKAVGDSIAENIQAVPRIDAKLGQEVVDGSPYELDEFEQTQIRGVSFITKEVYRDPTTESK